MFPGETCRAMAIEGCPWSPSLVDAMIEVNSAPVLLGVVANSPPDVQVKVLESLERSKLIEELNEQTLRLLNSLSTTDARVQKVVARILSRRK